MKLPKLWRKKRGGRFVGSYLATIAGEDVNLRTSDATKATERLRAAVQRGRRAFDDDQAAAVDLEGAAAAEAPAAPGPNAGAPPAPVAAPPAPPPLQLPAMSPEAAAGDADDMAAAAADVAGDAANDNAGAPEADPEVLDALLEQGAAVIVDAQLQLQAHLIKRRTGKIAGEIPQDSQLRTGAAKAWVAQLKIWFPSTTMLPSWAMALIIPVMALPVQLAMARKPEDMPADPPMAAAQ